MKITINTRLMFLLMGQLLIMCHEKNVPSYLMTNEFTQFPAKEYAVDSNFKIQLSTRTIDTAHLKKIKAGNPIITRIKNNKIHTGVLPKRKADTPEILRPGSNGLLLPKVIVSPGRKVIQNLSTPFKVKDMEYKHPNPASIGSFGRVQGLRSSIITCLLQDHLGNIWIGTPAGVTKYDGQTFTNFTTGQGLVYNDVRALFQDKAGNIWMGTLGGGVSRYDGKYFTNFTTSEGLPNNVVMSITEDHEGNIWFGSYGEGGGITKFRNDSLTNYSVKQGLPSEYTYSIITDKAGNLWIGTSNGLSEFDGKVFKNYTTRNGLGSNSVYNLANDTQGRLWVATNGGGVSIFDGEEFSTLDSLNGLIHNEVFSLAEDNSGNMWIGTHYGLSKFDGNTLTNYHEDQGLTNTNIYCLLQDRSGNIWIGSAGGGLMKYNPVSFTHITETEGLPKNYAFAVYKDLQHHLWIGAWRGGVTEFDGSTLKTLTTSQGMPNNDVRGITQDQQGNYWMAIYHGVVRYNRHNFMRLTKNEGLVDDDVNCIMQDSKKNLWIGTENGASTFDGKFFKNYFSAGAILHVNFIKEDSRGNIWLATSAGIYKINETGISWIGDSTGPFRFLVSHICEDHSGNLWFATSKGVLKYDRNSFINLTEKEGLISNEVTSVIEDSLHNIWIGTRFGLSKLSPDKEMRIASGIQSNPVYRTDVLFKNFGHNDNFLGMSCNTAAVTEAHDYGIALGTPEGVTLFDPLSDYNDTTPPDLQLTQLKIANQNLNWNLLENTPDTEILLGNGSILKDYQLDSVSRWYAIPQNLRLNWQNNYVTIDFSGITTDQPQNIRYQYHLTGLRNDPFTFTNQSSASYVNLAPGNYEFKVKAMNYAGIWSKELTYPFTILPPWWQTWWARSLAAIIFALTIFLIARLIFRFNLQKRQSVMEKELALQYERQRISSDLHDEIGSTLSSINIYTGLARTEKNKDSFLESISKNVTEVVSKLDDLVWKINPRYDSLGSVITRLMFYADPLAQANQIKISLNVEEPLKTLNLNAESKHHLFLILKELVNNAIKHAHCQNIFLTISQKGNQLTILVKDDGEGMLQTSGENQRNGMKNIASRIHELKGLFQIESDPVEGTLIRLIIPVL